VSRVAERTGSSGEQVNGECVRAELLAELAELLEVWEPEAEA
jgi:hypothetical protein